MIILGIDPGLSATGLAWVCDGAQPRLLDIRTMRGARMFAQVVSAAKYHGIQPDLVAVQVPQMNPAIFGDNARARAMGVVKNAALANEIVGWLEGQRYDVVKIAPGRGSGCKMPLAQWRAIWRYKGRTSQDARDAAMIALQGGRKISLDTARDIG